MLYTFPTDTEFGCWITPADEMENLLPLVHRESAELFRSGYVEVRYGRRSTLVLWGTLESIQRSKSTWTSLAGSVNNIMFYIVASGLENTAIDRPDFALDQILDSEISFSYPDELHHLEGYLGLQQDANQNMPNQTANNQ